MPLTDSGSLTYERRASVRIEGEDNSSVSLYEVGNGIYRADQLALRQDSRYRLHIISSTGKEFISDFVSPKRTPPIDTLTWQREADGIDLYINTHDPQNNTRYYKWEYDETWEFNSTYFASLKYVYNSLGFIIGIDTTSLVEFHAMYTCWASESSKRMLIGSSARLSQDTINQELLNIPNSSWKFTVLYSINVRQYALTKEGYEYLQLIKKNTEQTGGLFDAQPSQLRGNIRCVTDTTEPVVGFIEISDAQEKRFFIRRSDVNPWPYSQGCTRYSVPNNADTLNKIQEDWIPSTVHEYGQFGEIKRFWVSTPECVDCRTRGTSEKPSFWP